jgi:hypothetical protein
MSVRTEPRADLSDRLQGALHISADQLQQQGVKLESSAPSSAPASMAMTHMDASVGAPVPNEQALAEANTFNTSNPEFPLQRTMVVSVRASFNDLCLRKQAACWTPTADAVKSILQQARAKPPRKLTPLELFKTPLRRPTPPRPSCAAQVCRPRRHRRAAGRSEGA